MARDMLPKTSKCFYLPSVQYQLKERGLELLKCNADGYCMYSALNRIEHGNAPSLEIRDRLLYGVRENTKLHENILTMAEGVETIDDYCHQKENVSLTNEVTWGDCGMLYVWCYLNQCNVRIYSVHNQTKQLQEMTYPATYPTTFHDSDKHGLFCMEIIMML